MDKIVSDLVNEAIEKAEPLKNEMLEGIKEGNGLKNAVYLLVFRETADTFIQMLKEHYKDKPEMFDILIDESKKKLKEMELAYLEKI